MTRILVTGGAGLLGSTLVPLLAGGGHDVRVLGRRSAAPVCADLADPDATARALDAVTPEVIINLAAATNVDECERDPAYAFVANASTVHSIVRWMQSRPDTCHLVHLSTDQLYDGAGPHVETDVRPANYYAYSKYLGELHASRVGATIVRTNLFGRSRVPGRASISDWLVERLRRHERTPVFADVLFSPLSLDSLSRLIALLAAQRLPGTFNLGSNEGMSKAEFAFQLARSLDLETDVLVPIQSAEAGLQARRPKDMRMDCRLLEARLGLTLPTLAAEIELMRIAYANPA